VECFCNESNADQRMGRKRGWWVSYPDGIMYVYPIKNCNLFV
jgi:hypothetical protein